MLPCTLRLHEGRIPGLRLVLVWRCGERIRNVGVVYVLSMRYDRTRVAAVTFSTTVGDQFYLNSYTSKEAIINAMNFHHKGGRTNTQEALNVMRATHFTPSHGEHKGMRNVAVLISEQARTINEICSVLNILKKP